eukprot:TRINITY_DN7473_c0_g1_i1.p1 TRINITY_DN7473_c0_g1~~TRINITY_DN7473_c0_g1_i1.p1  ORF type:complete len:398 (+),score=58.25 TRINITY_DN7473_c0_g1_i1:69-1262(+)
MQGSEVAEEGARLMPTRGPRNSHSVEKDSEKHTSMRLRANIQRHMAFVENLKSYNELYSREAAPRREDFVQKSESLRAIHQEVQDKHARFDVDDSAFRAEIAGERTQTDRGRATSQPKWTRGDSLLHSMLETTPSSDFNAAGRFEEIKEMISPKGNNIKKRNFPIVPAESALGGASGMKLQELKKKEPNTKNSELLLREHYLELLESTHYRAKPNPPATLASQSNKCKRCSAPISRGLIIVKNNAVYCNYTGTWVCSACAATDKALLPWEVIEKFSFKTFKVSIDAKQELDELYPKPILFIDVNNPMFVKTPALYDCLLMKRQLHLIYDMICDITYVHDLLQGTNLHLVLKEPWLSMKNLFEVYNGGFILYLEKCFNFLVKHIVSCAVKSFLYHFEF